jgi:hypothetical protein
MNAPISPCRHAPDTRYHARPRITGLGVVTEATLRQFAAHRRLQIPSPRIMWFWANPNFSEQVAAWQDEARGDLARLREATPEDYPLDGLQKLRSMHFLGGGDVMRVMQFHRRRRRQHGGTVVPEGQVLAAPGRHSGPDRCGVLHFCLSAG